MPDLSQFVLYSGGLKGAESEFGRNAERWGIKEINFTFIGHQMERIKFVKFLTEEELQQGDDTMQLVSDRMEPSYIKALKIRRVVQSIFHMVRRGHQVLVVGWIQPDNTVKGGTGWAVELAKFFNRPVSVFDQAEQRWFTWKDNHWEPDEPLICHSTFAGTGTRSLSEEGRTAIRALFERSFGPPPKRSRF